MLSDTLVSVVCHDLMPEGQALLRLRAALGKLADWYGLPDDEPVAVKSRQDIDQAAAR